ncbi:MAG: S1C family serine protease [Eubacteriales bacterium]
MKNKRCFKIISATILAVAMLICTFSFSGCGLLSGSINSVSSVRIDDNGDLIVKYSNGKEENLGIVSGNTTVVDGGTTVVNAEAGNLTAATSKGLQSVVSVYCTFELASYYPYYGNTSYSSAGAGVIYRLDRDAGNAFIVTNYHVVYDSKSNTSDHVSDDIKIYLYGSETTDKAISAEYVGGSANYDIAVLYVRDSAVLKASCAQQAEIGNSDDVVVGQQAIAIGNPEALGISATCGIVSVDSEYISMTASDNSGKVQFRVMRIDTAVNSGNSGGGLFNSAGELIGIVNAKVKDNSVENISYAIPSNVARSIADNIIDYCFEKDCKNVRRCILGVTLGTNNSHSVHDSETGLVRIEENVFVKTVESQGLANGILEVGDVIRSVNIGDRTINVTRRYHVIDPMLDVRVGDTVTFNIERNGVEQSVSITVTESCIADY